MNNRNTGMIATIATALLCGCPGIFLCIFGIVAATGNLPYTTTLNGVESAGTTPVSYGVVMMCAALIFILIPIVVGVVTLRRKPQASGIDQGPLPPTS